METSKLALIDEYSQCPLEMFCNILGRCEDDLVTMNLATLDSELSILNRTVVYRGLLDGAVTFVTERNTRKYQNLKDNPKVALTFLFSNISASNGTAETWQVRLFDAVAKELQPKEIKTLWQEETLFAKIRSHICECGLPVDPAELKHQHDQLLKDFHNGVNKLPKTATYTAFKIIPNRWDFYKTEPNKIADRVQYRRKQDNQDAAEEWEVFHVAA